MASSVLLLKLGLLSFWGLWFVMVFSTNLFEGFKVIDPHTLDMEVRLSQ